MALYTDRAGWAFHTPTAGGRVDRTHLTVVGRILARLGIEHIPSYSPQARGRVERLNRTLQGRLVNELRVAGIATLEAANAYLREQFIADYNSEFTRPPPIPPVRSSPSARPGPRSVSRRGRRAARRPRQCRELRRPRPAARQAAGTAELRGLARPGAAAPHWHAHRLARPAVPGPLRCHRPAPGRPSPARAEAPRTPRGRPTSRPKNARAHVAQDAPFRGRPSQDIPPLEAQSRRRRGPRLPVGPRE